jgi:hypothetical protein
MSSAVKKIRKIAKKKELKITLVLRIINVEHWNLLGDAGPGT